MAAIEHGNGQQVEHAKVNAEHGHKPQQIRKTALSTLPHGKFPQVRPEHCWILAL